MDKHPSSTCMCTIWFGDWQKIYMYIHKIMISYDKWLVRGSTQIHPDISGWWCNADFTGSATDSPSPFTIAWSLPLQLDMAMFSSWRRQGPRARKTPSWAATWVSGGQSIQVQWWFGLSYLVLKSHLTFVPQIQKQSCNILGIYIPYIHPLGLWFILSITVKLSETTPYSHHAKLCGIGIPANFVAVHNSKKLEIYNDLCRYYSFI